MIRGLLDLYEASLDEQWLEWAVTLQAKLDELFWDSTGAGYFMATPDDPSILVRMKEGLKNLTLLSLNPVTLKTPYQVILLTVCLKILVILVRRIWYWIS